MHWAILLGIAVISDILDYFGAAVPIIGDVLDLLTMGVLYPYLGVETAGGAIELIPGADFLPTYTVLVAWTIWRERNRQNTGLKGLDIPRTESGLRQR